ncbi:MAG: DUF1501 domain-containing protein [Armatimonadota bacterium]
MRSPLPGCPGFRRSAPLRRRELLRAGSLSLLGLSLPRLLEAQALAAPAAGAPRSFGRAKRVILLFMWGGPAQQDTWDMKPDAPEEYRGPFKPIGTNVDGIRICEHFPRLAQRCDQLAIVRSVYHPDVNHTTATHFLLTGEDMPNRQGSPSDDWPSFGAVLGRLGRANPTLPPYVVLRPETKLDVPRFVEDSRGQGAGWLGPALQPFTIDADPNSPEYASGEFSLSAELGPARLRRRLGLRDQLDSRVRLLERHPMVQAHDTSYERAFNLLSAEGAGRAFDLSRESEQTREKYGRHMHGQAVLQARRLIEAGVPLVTVFWQNEGIKNVSVYWDTHQRNFIDLKERLMPPADQAFSALLDDLRDRGLLDETLILWTGEFGRTPRVGQSVVGGAGASADGRDHWPHVFTSVLAGGGIRGGQVYGKSDSLAAYPEEDGVRPADLAATMYHLLGIPPDTFLRDVQDRPLPLCSGTPIVPLLR